MAVTEETPIASSVANGVTTVFPHSFTLLDEADLVVTQTVGGVTSTYTLGADYTVSGVGSSSGSVTFLVAPANGTIVTRYRDIALERATDYQDNGDLLADTVNLDFDRLWFALQDIFNGGKVVPTCVRAPNGETLNALPAALSRAGYFLGFDVAGQPTLLAATSGTASALSADLATGSDALKGDALVAVKRLETGAVAATLHNWIQSRSVSVKDFGAVGDGVTDDTTAIQAALDAGAGPVYMPPGVYCVSDELVIPDGGGIIGASAHWKRRTGYVYDGGKNTVIKYIGAGGSNTCVVRASELAVGTEGTDFTAPATDDLIDVTLRDFHVDANNLAEIGIYIYRAGNQATIGNLTAEKAKKFCQVHLGCYAADFGVFAAYESEEHGVAVGWDIFSWGSVEASCFAYSAKFLLANNGTAGTYVAGSGTDLDGSGGKFSVGRGSVVEITSESNDGRACILSQYNSANATMGPTDYILRYIEGNADGPYVDYRDAMDGIRLMNGFLHPGNGSSLLPQNIKIDGKNNSGVTTADSGPSRDEEWLQLLHLSGDLSGVGVDIDSNTFKYKIIDCQPYFTFSGSRPGSYAFNLALAGASVAGTQTYSLRSGFATRVGNLVHVTGRVTLSALDGATSGQIRITGLPYRISGTANLYGGAVIGAWNGLTTSVVGLYGTLTNGTSYIALNKVTAAATSSLTNLLPADLSNTSLIQFSATYITDDA